MGINMDIALHVVRVGKIVIFDSQFESFLPAISMLNSQIPNLTPHCHLVKCNILRLIEDATLAKKMGENGIKRVNELFKPDRMAIDYMSLLTKNRKQ